LSDRPRIARCAGSASGWRIGRRVIRDANGIIGSYVAAAIGIMSPFGDGSARDKHIRSHANRFAQAVDGMSAAVAIDFFSRTRKRGSRARALVDITGCASYSCRPFVGP
jgi:hypothetical protein